MGASIAACYSDKNIVGAVATVHIAVDDMVWVRFEPIRSHKLANPLQHGFGTPGLIKQIVFYIRLRPSSARYYACVFR